MPRATGSSCTSTAAGVPRSTRNNSCVRRSRSTAQKRKLPGGWPPRTRPRTWRGMRSTSGTPMPRRGCPSTAPSTGCARSTATNPGTTNCAPKRSIRAARPCTPTLRTIQGCSSDQHARQRTVPQSPHARRTHEENTTTVTVGVTRHSYAVNIGTIKSWRHNVEILKVHNLSKVYGKGDTQIKAIDDVSFNVEKGEFVAIVGPSGSGKSTLLHILGGVDTPSSGQLLVDGTDICALDQTKLAIFRRQQIGLIYQFYNLIPILNVEENISLPLLLDERSLDEARLKEIIATLGLTDRTKHLPNQLSGGQQQRVSIGRALINTPALVLADEPTGNLDSANSKEIISLLKLSNKRYHQTLIIVTHDRDIALQADRIITFGDGRILRDEAVRA